MKIARKEGGKARSGFTLIEMMIMVAIVGILAAAAIPSFRKYIKRSKASEVGLNLRKIYDGEVSFYYEEHVFSNGQPIPRYFVSLPTEPPVPKAEKQIGNFAKGDWPRIKFNPDGPVYFAYSVVSSGSGTTAAFTARAQGDLHGDANYSLYERVAFVNSQTGDIDGSPAVFVLDDGAPLYAPPPKDCPPPPPGCPGTAKKCLVDLPPGCTW